MLVLARRQGESLIIADDIRITVLIIYKTQIKLGVNDSEVVTVNLEESISIADGISVSVEEIMKSQVRLGIKAPESMKVDREEVPKEGINKYG